MTKKLGERIQDINFWKFELQRGIDDMIAETDLLFAQKVKQCLNFFYLLTKVDHLLVLFFSPISYQLSINDHLSFNSELF